MISKYLNKQKDFKKKKKLVKVMIDTIKIPDKQKYLYHEAIEILDSSGLEKLYEDMSRFIENIENEEINDINTSNFANIGGLRKKDLKEKKEEENAFSFLLNNL